ncbi:DUF2147 domain-containing protein [Enterovirga aerilata]|uniref:DUF2147 domain-containing protein n=1 Tax=Enterovirga aerilata TaxID=2730920 RepID=A0A849I564_9HYPH|nr:DUF2147 domain-containing protein [Enterovirga sp. DB1703]NNM72471.1 DUF2147 domain-containing protein [Enterovirga sp. DB1703]
MMVKTPAALFGLAAGLLAACPSSAAPARDPSGTWLTEDERARIRVEKCGPTQENLCGYVVWMKPQEGEDPSAKRDSKNPDPRKRNRPVLGHQLMMGLTLNDEGRYVGKIYNNEDGKSYDVTVWSEQPGTLNVRGCLIAFLCSTQIWTRTNSVLPGQLAGATGTPGGPTPDPEWASRPPVTPASAAPAQRREQPRPKP